MFSLRLRMSPHYSPHRRTIQFASFAFRSKKPASAEMRLYNSRELETARGEASSTCAIFLLSAPRQLGAGGGGSAGCLGERESFDQPRPTAQLSEKSWRAREHRRAGKAASISRLALPPSFRPSFRPSSPPTIPHPPVISLSLSLSLSQLEDHSHTPSLPPFLLRQKFNPLAGL